MRRRSVGPTHVRFAHDFRKTVMRMSHAELTEAEYARALEALEAAFVEERDFREGSFNRKR